MPRSSTSNEVRGLGTLWRRREATPYRVHEALRGALDALPATLGCVPDALRRALETLPAKHLRGPDALQSVLRAARSKIAACRRMTLENGWEV
eukprot:2704484-Pyramimonas_sp.AAC.1